MFWKRRTAPKDVPPEESAPDNRRTILIVDDNAAFRGMLKSMLELRNYKPVVASTASEGLVLSSGFPFDAVLVDYEMPVTNGLEFCRVFQEQNKAKGRNIPIWLMTGTLDPEVGKRAGDVGAMLVLRKPFNVDELCVKLEQTMQPR